MSLKNTIANKKRWAKVPTEERSKRMSKIATERHKNSSLVQKKKLGRFLANARKAKTI